MSRIKHSKECGPQNIHVILQLRYLAYVFFDKEHFVAPLYQIRPLLRK
jgi:hypothetical protein